MATDMAMVTDTVTVMIPDTEVTITGIPVPTNPVDNGEKNGTK